MKKAKDWAGEQATAIKVNLTRVKQKLQNAVSSVVSKVKGLAKSPVVTFGTKVFKGFVTYGLPLLQFFGIETPDELREGLKRLVGGNGAAHAFSV
jgi:glutaredoxin-related protein